MIYDDIFNNMIGKYINKIVCNAVPTYPRMQMPYIKLCIIINWTLKNIRYLTLHF